MYTKYDLPTTLNVLKCQFWKSTGNWGKKAIRSNFNVDWNQYRQGQRNFKETSTTGSQCSYYLIGKRKLPLITTIARTKEEDSASVLYTMCNMCSICSFPTLTTSCRLTVCIFFVSMFYRSERANVQLRYLNFTSPLE